MEPGRGDRDDQEAVWPVTLTAYPPQWSPVVEIGMTRTASNRWVRVPWPQWSPVVETRMTALEFRVVDLGF